MNLVWSVLSNTANRFRQFHRIQEISFVRLVSFCQLQETSFVDYREPMYQLTMFPNGEPLSKHADVSCHRELTAGALSMIRQCLCGVHLFV